MSFANAQPFVTNIRPGFVGDFLNREHVLPGGVKLDAATFEGADAVRTAVSGAVAAGLSAVPVAALAGPIPTGTTIKFSATKFATVTTAAAAGAVSLVTDPIPTAFVGG